MRNDRVVDFEQQLQTVTLARQLRLGRWDTLIGGIVHGGNDLFVK